MERVIVTGANGFIGSYLVNYLTKMNILVYAVVRNENSEITYMERNSYLKIIYCDMNHIHDLSSLILDQGFDVFFHLAWEGSSGKLRTDYQVQLNNVNATIQAIETAAELKCKKFVCSGSVTELVCENYLSLDDCKLEDVMYYPVAKITARYMSKLKCNDLNIEFCWAQIANIYGVGDRTGNFINMLIEHYSKGIEPSLTKGDQLADFIYVSDVAEALWGIGKYGSNMITYYVGGNHIRALRDFVIKVNALVNPDVKSGLGKKEFNGRSIDFEKIDVDKLKRHAGVTANVDFDRGIRLMLDNK